MTPKYKNCQIFADSFNIEPLIKEPTRFNGSPSSIDLVITNWKTFFKKHVNQKLEYKI